MRGIARTRREHIPESILDVSDRQLYVRGQARIDGGKMLQTVEKDCGLLIVRQSVWPREAGLRQCVDISHGVPQIARWNLSRVVVVVTNQIIEQHAINCSACSGSAGNGEGVPPDPGFLCDKHLPRRIMFMWHS